MIRIKRTNLVELIKHQVHESFGVQDNKGRDIGARITFATCDQVPAPEEEDGYSLVSTFTGPAWGFMGQATRNRVPHLARYEFRWFASAAEMGEAVTRYLADARKRAKPGKA
jgi:hypothetical protein